MKLDDDVLTPKPFSRIKTASCPRRTATVSAAGSGVIGSSCVVQNQHLRLGGRYCLLILTRFDAMRILFRRRLRIQWTSVPLDGLTG